LGVAAAAGLPVGVAAVGRWEWLLRPACRLFNSQCAAIALTGTAVGVDRGRLPRPDAIGKCGLSVVFSIYAYSSLACLYGFTHCHSSMVIDIADVCTRI
jgi:hypothetical protein